jgi:prepilin-type processing-associated H-X9-DG protein
MGYYAEECVRRPLGGSPCALRRYHRRKGFTLIVLLVVVAIISLLVSILLPSLNQAKELAKVTMCLTNVKSQMIGVQMYEAEHEVYPPVYWGNYESPFDRTTWASFIFPYVTGGLKIRTMEPGAWWPDSQQVSLQKVFSCPAADGSSICFPVVDDGQIHGPHYAYSDLIHQIPNDSSQGYDTRWLRSTDLGQPSVIRMFCDAEYHGTHFCPICTPEGLLGWDIPAFGRHLEGLNIGYWDGHGEYLHNEDVQGNPEMQGHDGL